MRTKTVRNADAVCPALGLKAVAVTATNLKEPSRMQLSVSEVARRLSVRPREISDLFYARELRDDLCPIIAGRRLIPEECIPVIERVLRQRGLLPSVPSCCGLEARAAATQRK